MGVIKQLYKLQEFDLEIESNEQTLSQLTSQLGESQAVVKTQNELASAQQQLEESRQQQQSIEWEIEDITTKTAAAEETLYSGRVQNPKELASLQQEVEGFKSRRTQLEDRVLDIMEQVELATANIATIDSKLKKLEAEWNIQQQQLTAKIEQTKSTLNDLAHKQQLQLAQIDPQAVQLYQKLRKQGGPAVARVAQGICSGCRISLSTSELQRARSGNLIQCSSCGRILFQD
ncbi:zinc ribbon domain-containing protein [Chloroflexota bacterium]